MDLKALFCFCKRIECLYILQMIYQVLKPSTFIEHGDVFRKVKCLLMVTLMAADCVVIVIDTCCYNGTLLSVYLCFQYSGACAACSAEQVYVY